MSDFKDEILVTVIIFAYNHKHFIENAISSVLEQETDFKYEIIIRDDASTDGTADIVTKMYKEYPDTIVPVLHKNNYFSRGDFSLKEIRNLIRGYYVAFLDGDDYWSDKSKLQRQVSALESNANCVIATHKVQVVMDDKEKKERYYPIRDDIVAEGYTDADTMANVVITKSMYPFHTSSYLIKRDVLMKFYENQIYYNDIIGIQIDMQLIYAALQLGGFYYINRVMSCYRESQIDGCNQASKQMKANFDNWRINVIHSLLVFDEILNKKYHEYILTNIERVAISCFHQGDVKTLKELRSCGALSIKRIVKGEVENIDNLKAKIYWCISVLFPQIIYRLGKHY